MKTHDIFSCMNPENIDLIAYFEFACSNWSVSLIP